MNILLFAIQLLFVVVSVGALVLSIPLFFAFRWPAAAMWGVKVYVSALSPLLAALGVASALVGLATGSVFTAVLGVVVALLYGLHFISITRPPAPSDNFSKAFGRNWAQRILPEQRRYFLPRRTALRLPAVPGARLQQDLCFATLPGTDRKLLCDLWLPPGRVKPSGVVFIYLHGSAFYFLDKDFGTRPLFGHLAAQGHVIMDVAYRLAPETDIMGMVHDTKRAIAWVKEHARTYGVSPERVVVGGGSAGGHLALMAAYTSGDPRFTPEDLKDLDLGVDGVISLYGPTDLEALYYHTGQHLTTRAIPGKPKRAVPTKAPRWLIQSVGKDCQRLGMDKGFENIGTLAPIMGGHPDECGERYALLSPLTHVHPHCPPTLLVHGEHDIMAPAATTRRLFARLQEAGTPVVLHLLPQTDHAFDLVLPRLSPSAHNALYDVERFLALVASREGTVGSWVTASGRIIMAGEEGN